MKSLILITAARSLLAILLLFSLLLLVRGHNEPGGGFSGGLVAAAAFILYGIAFGPEVARRALRVAPLTLIQLGLAIAVGSGLLSVLLGLPFMTGLWTANVPAVGYVGTPLLFDIGVYVTVLGVLLVIVLSLLEE
jgi:multicomponent Na+:H+ antiporter subunit B